ncbi:3-oxoacyl-[acyl-carrier protein] reductase [Tamaricihabitans halophyticus]|uniref:3-oxoacyl-[acyl-carrier protein] reductase n=1 Tax=Tamaricihabitans halophyticus TaxID=1262583 RepID=A0A4R2Q927_9PSEU|nr:3-oxoacyl-[acyl-carrier protein] reductase [Tamaricihabitans halophyticus]
MDKVAIVTGAGAGLGRAEALALAGAGANVVLGDIDPDALDAVVAEASALGVEAIGRPGDVALRETADALTAAAVETFGGLHVLVNNAGMVRDRMLFNMSDAEWDDVVRVHLRGHFLLSRNAAGHWRSAAKDRGEPVYGRIVNTASEAFLLGSEGQPNYAAAKAGIVALTLSSARGLARYGVRANAICPRARTAMTEHVFGPAPGTDDDALDPENVARFVSYLAAPAAEVINGQVFVIYGGMVALLAAPSVEQRFDAADGRWNTETLAAALGPYFARRDPERTFACTEVMSLSEPP